MATFYIPDSTGWKSSLAVGSGYGHLRIRIDQTYNAATNKSSFKASIEIKSDGTGSGTGYHMQDGGSFKFPSSGSSAATVDADYSLSTLSTSEWNALRVDGSTKYWSATVTHNANGTVTVYASVSGFRLQNSGRTRVWTWDKSGSITIASTPSYTLALTAGTGSTIAVKRTSSPKQGAATGALANGATIYYGDVLEISFSTSTGYNLNAHTVNGANFSSGGSHTVTAAVAVLASATVKSFLLALTAGTGSIIRVDRTSSPKQGAATGALGDGDVIYYDDVLSIAAAADTGYVLRSASMNGGAIETPTTVRGDILLVAAAIPAGAYLDIAVENAVYQIFIDTGVAYAAYIPYVDTGSSWELY